MRVGNLSNRLTLFTEQGAIDVEQSSGGLFGADPQAVYDRWDEFIGWVASPRSVTKAVPYATENLGPRAPRPRQVFAIGANYHAHLKEGDFPVCERDCKSIITLPAHPYLTDAEVGSWLSVVRMMTWLPWSIDQQLRRDSNLGMVEYQVMARLSHLVKRLEERGLVRREADPVDGRFTNAILTGEGFRVLAAAAPGHVAHVRSLVIDVLSPEQLRRMGRAADRIMARIDTSEIN